MSQKVEQTSDSTRIRQLAALAGFITSILASLSFESVQYWLKNKTLLRKKLMEVFEIANDEFAEVREDWRFFYSNRHITADFLSVQIPPKPAEGSWRLIFIPAGLKMNTVLAVMRAEFKTWTYNEDLDASVTTNTRTSSQSYAIWVRDGVEPDEKYLGQSTRQADPNCKVGMTLLERMVLEVKYFVETGKHLDEVGITFCTGSRLSDGDVPSMYWGPGSGEVGVRWYGLDFSGPVSGLREAVSL